MSELIQIGWPEVKHRFIDCVRHGKPWNQAKGRDLAQLHADPYAVDSWAGGSAAQTLDRIDNGFYAPELQAAADLVPTTTQLRPSWSEEEGDIDVGRLVGGYDDYMFDVGPRDSKPGLKLTADVFFAGAVDAKVVREYGAWLAGLIGGFETNGYDLEIGLTTPVDQLYQGGGRTTMEINVKRPGEMSDFTEWSALFGPTGLRHLIFTAFGVASEKVGKQQTAFMSMSITEPKWNVSYDADANHLHVSVDQRHGRDAFPAERLNGQLAECGLI